MQQLKLDILNREMLKLKSVLDGFQEDRCQIEKAREIIKSMCNIVNIHHSCCNDYFFKQNNFFRYLIMATKTIRMN
jgi:hypothetical protein